MNATSLHLKILKCLEYDNYTLKELSLILGVSESILRRNIKELEDILGFNNVFKENKNLKSGIYNFFYLKKNQDFLIEERKIYIILNFLFNDVINLTELSIDLKVTRRTIANDINSLKKDLRFFNLKVESINFLGVKLIGNESDKRILFKLYISKILRDTDYLPKKLKFLLKEIQNIINLKEVTKIVKYIINNVKIPCSGLLIKHLEILIAISIIRKDNIDQSLREYETRIIGPVDSNIINFIETIKFFTKYDKMTILRYCALRDYDNILNNEKSYLIRMENLLNVINLKFNTNFKLNKELIIKFYSLLKSYDFKKEFKIKEFYLYNKNLSKNYGKLFDKIKKIILSQFKEIDSFDLMVMSTILLELLSRNLNSEIKKLQNIAIVYNFLNPLILKDLSEKLSLDDIVEPSNYVYINHLNEYLKNNEVEYFLIFEDLDLSIYNLKILKLTLPISTGDELKLKNMIGN